MLFYNESNVIVSKFIWKSSVLSSFVLSLWLRTKAFSFLILNWKLFSIHDKISEYCRWLKYPIDTSTWTNVRNLKTPWFKSNWICKIWERFTFCYSIVLLFIHSKYRHSMIDKIYCKVFFFSQFSFTKGRYQTFTLKYLSHQ